MSDTADNQPQPMTDEEFNASIAELARSIELYKRLRAMERAVGRYDPTALMQMPANAVDAMVAAVPDSLMRDIVRDFWKGVSQPSSLIPQQPVARGSGWVTPAPLRPPPGVELIDRMMATDDRRWRAERAKEFGVGAGSLKPFQRRV
jgi:hypothetical protein